MELSTAQKFELEQMRRAGQQMSREQAQELLAQAIQLLAIKNKIYQELLRKQ